jgi:hypothetical protein
MEHGGASLENGSAGDPGHCQAWGWHQRVEINGANLAGCPRWRTTVGENEGRGEVGQLRALDMESAHT